MTGWLERLKAWFSPAAPVPTVPLTGTDADVPALVLPTGQAAHFFEARAPAAHERGRDRGESHACDKCGAALEAVLFTSWGTEVWRSRPVVTDGWRCSGCGSMTAPAFLTPQQVTAIQDAGAAAGRLGDLDTAEFHFRRVATSWPGYPLAAMNLASVYMDRLAAGVPPEEEARCRGIVESELRVAAAADPVPHPFVHQTLAKILAYRGDDDAAREQLRLLRAHPGSGPDEARVASELDAFLDGRWHLFETGSEKVQRHMLVRDRDHDPSLAGARQELREGIAALETFAALHPEHWQCRWLLGKAYQALEDNTKALDWLEQAFEAGGGDNPNIGREYAQELLVAGRGTDAVRASEQALSLAPDDVTLIGNLAVCQLVAGDTAAAHATISRGMHDDVNRDIAQLIDDVRSGRRSAPDRLLPGGRLPR